MKDQDESNARTLKVLSESEMYHDYERAFTEGTGLPLLLHRPACSPPADFYNLLNFLLSTSSAPPSR